MHTEGHCTNLSVLVKKNISQESSRFVFFSLVFLLSTSLSFSTNLLFFPWVLVLVNNTLCRSTFSHVFVSPFLVWFSTRVCLSTWPKTAALIFKNESQLLKRYSLCMFASSDNWLFVKAFITSVGWLFWRNVSFPHFQPLGPRFEPRQTLWHYNSMYRLYSNESKKKGLTMMTPDCLCNVSLSYFVNF